MADDAHAGVVGEEARELFRGEVGAVGDGDLAGVDGAADPDAAAVVQGNPGGAGGGVEQGIEQRPVGDRVGAVGHGLGLAVRGGDGAGVEVVAADHDGRLDLAFLDELVEQQAGLGAFAVAEPADAGREALELDPLGGGVEPAVQVLVLREEFLDGLVRDGDVLGVTGEGNPAERAEALAEQRADVGRDEAGEFEGAVIAALAGLVADGVAVVEDLGAGVLELDHGLDVPGHRGLRLLGEAFRDRRRPRGAIPRP